MSEPENEYIRLVDKFDKSKGLYPVVDGSIYLPFKDKLIPATGNLPFSYEIFQDEYEIVYAKNGRTGKIEFSDADASKVIQYAVNALPSGGKIFIKAGVYNCLSPIVIQDKYHFTIEGEGMIGYPVKKTGNTVLFKKFNGTLITISYTTADAINSFTIRNIAMLSDWSLYTGGALSITNAQWFWIENVVINRFEGTGITLSGCGGFRIINSYVLEIKNGHGIYIYNSIDWQLHNVEVDTNDQASGYSALRIDTNSPGEIIGGHFEGFRCIDTDSRIVAIGVLFAWARERCIWIRAGYSAIIGCMINGGNQNNEFTGDAGAQVYFSGYVPQCKLIGNYLSSSYATYSVADNASDCNYLYMLGNTVFRPVQIDGYGARVIGNIFSSAVSFNTYKLYARGNYGYYTENFKTTGLSVPIGTGGAYGSAVSIKSLSGVISYPRVKITWGGTFGSGETVTVKVEASYIDGTTAYIEKSATAAGSTWLSDDDILSLIAQGKDIVQLNVYAKTNLSSTSVTVTVDAYGKS